MAQLSIRRLYAANEALTKDDLDVICEDLETFFNQTKITDDNVQDAGITASSKVTAGTITTALFPNDIIVAAKIADGAVTTAKFTDISVTTPKLASNSITTAKIAANAVTFATREAVNIVTDLADATSINSASMISTGLEKEITTTGRPVFVGITSGGVVSPSGCVGFNAGSGTGSIGIEIRRDGTAIAVFTTGFDAAGIVYYPVTSVKTIDTPSSGTYTYTVYMTKGSSGNLTFTVHNLKLIVMEL